MVGTEKKRRVALIGTQALLGEGLQAILSHFEDVELIGLWECDKPHAADLPDCGCDYSRVILDQVVSMQPDAVVIADRSTPCPEVSSLIAAILEGHPNLPVIRAAIGEGTFQIYTMQTTPANTRQLIELIRDRPRPTPPTDEAK